MREPFFTIGHSSTMRNPSISTADSSGEHLHRRGWRTDVARAPLRETLAAAMVRASAWRPGEALVDPLCGSGTIVIEAALQALGVAPGLGRHFAFEDWPAHDAGAWEATRQAAAADRRNEVEVPILGSDRDAGAIDAAQANADRAGVGDAVEFTVAALSAAPALRRGLPAALVPGVGLVAWLGQRDARGLRELGDLLAGDPPLIPVPPRPVPPTTLPALSALGRELTAAVWR